MTAPSLALYAGIFAVGLLSLVGTAYLAFKGVAWCARSLARYLRERAMRRVLADRMADAASRYRREGETGRRLQRLWDERILPTIRAEEREAEERETCPSNFAGSECHRPRGHSLGHVGEADGATLEWSDLDESRLMEEIRAELAGETPTLKHMVSCGRVTWTDGHTQAWRDEQRSVDELREALRVQRDESLPRCTGCGCAHFFSGNPHLCRECDEKARNALRAVEEALTSRGCTGGYVPTTSTDYFVDSSGTTYTTLEGSSHGAQVVSGGQAHEQAHEHSAEPSAVERDPAAWECEVCERLRAARFSTVTDGTCGPLQFDSDGPTNPLTNRPAQRFHPRAWQLAGVQGCLCAVSGTGEVEVYQPEAKAWVSAHYSLADAARQVLRDANS